MLEWKFLLLVVAILKQNTYNLSRMYFIYVERAKGVISGVKSHLKRNDDDE